MSCRVLIVVARRYNGHELWTTLGTLQERDHQFEVISTDTHIVDEVTHQGNLIERTISEVDPDEVGTEFDALMVISGNMKDTELYWTHDRVLKYVDIAHSLDLPIAAICCSVPTIRRVAKGKQVSFFPLVRSRDLLKRAEAVLSSVSISVDGKLVTAEHQMATQMWAEAFCDILEGKEPELQLQDSGFVPEGKTPRRPPKELKKWLNQ